MVSLFENYLSLTISKQKYEDTGIKQQAILHFQRCLLM